MPQQISKHACFEKSPKILEERAKLLKKITFSQQFELN